MAVESLNLAYLIDPFWQGENNNGRPLVGGHMELFIAGTDIKYISYQDWDGTQHPFKIPLGSDGRATILVDPANTYDCYLYDSFGNLACSRLNVRPNLGGDVYGLTQVYHDQTLTGNGTPIAPLGMVSAKLGVEEPLYLVQDDTATIIGLHASAYSGLDYVENSALGYDADGNISGISGSGLNALVADYSKTASYAYTSDYAVSSESATWANSAVHDRLGRDIVDTYLTGVPDEYATKDFVISAVDSAVSGKYDTSSFSAISGDFLNRSGLEYQDGKITGYSGSAFSAGKVYSGISPVIVDNDNDTISVESATLGVQAPLYFVEDSESATIIGVSGLQPSGNYIPYVSSVSNKYITNSGIELTTNNNDGLSVRSTLPGPIGNFATNVGPGRIYLTGNGLNETVDAPKVMSWDDTRDIVSANSAMWALSGTEYSAGNFIDITDDIISVTGVEDTDSMGIGEGLYVDASGNLCASATSDYSAGDHIDITDNTISVTGTEEADSMGIGEHLYIDSSGNLNVSAAETDSMGIGEGLYIDNSGNLCASATGGANYSAGEHIDITDDTISVTGIEETDSLGLGEHLYVDASGNIDVSATETDSMGIGEGLYLDASGNLCASATGGANYSAGAFIDITDNVISVTDTAEADSLGLGEHLYIDNSGNIDVSAVEASALGIGEGLYIDNSGNLCASATGSSTEYSAGDFIDITDYVISVTNTAEASGLGIGDNLYIDDSGNLCASGIPSSASEAIDAVTANSAQWAQSGIEYSATAPIYIDSGNIGISAKDFNLTAPLVMTEDASAVNITVSAKDFEVQSPLYLTENNSAVTLGISGILYESGFGYDSNSAISGYNGSAFAGGGISTDTILWSGDQVGSAFTITLNEPISNFERIYVLGYTNDTNKTRTFDLMTCPDQLAVAGVFQAGTTTQTNWGQKFWTLEFTDTTVHPVECSEMQWGTTNHSNMNTFGILKVVGINRIAGGN